MSGLARGVFFFFRGGGRGAFVNNPTSVTNNAVTSHRVMVIMRWQAPRQRGAREALLARW